MQSNALLARHQALARRASSGECDEIVLAHSLQEQEYC